MYSVVGPAGGTEGLKRDPYARDLTDDPNWPECQCISIDPQDFPWHDHGFRSPLFHDLIIYQFHIGVWNIPTGRSNGTFLDVVEKCRTPKVSVLTPFNPNRSLNFPACSAWATTVSITSRRKRIMGSRTATLPLPSYLASVNQKLLSIDPGFTPYNPEDIQGTAN